MNFSGKICFHTFHGTYISCDFKDNLTCGEKTKGREQAFELINVGDKVAIKTIYGKYLSTDGLLLQVNKTEISDTEKFTLEKHEGGKFSLKTCNDKYVSATNLGTIVAYQNKVQEWEEYSIEPFDITKEGEETIEKNKEVEMNKEIEKYKEIEKKIENLDEEIGKLEKEKKKLKKEKKYLNEELDYLRCICEGKPVKKKERWHPEGYPEPPPGKHYEDAPSAYSREFGTDWMLVEDPDSD